MNPDNINPYFNKIKPLLKKLPENRLKACLDFVKEIKEIDRIIIGTTSEKELKEIITEYSKPNLNINYSLFKTTDENFILPQNWRL